MGGGSSLSQRDKVAGQRAMVAEAAMSVTEEDWEPMA